MTGEPSLAGTVTWRPTTSFERDVAALGNEVAYPVALHDVLARHHVAHLKGLPGNDHLGDLAAIALERLRTLSVGIRANLLPVGQA